MVSTCTIGHETLNSRCQIATQKADLAVKKPTHSHRLSFCPPAVSVCPPSASNLHQNRCVSKCCVACTLLEGAPRLDNRNIAQNLGSKPPCSLSKVEAPHNMLAYLFFVGLQGPRSHSGPRSFSFCTHGPRRRDAPESLLSLAHHLAFRLLVHLIRIFRCVVVYCSFFCY